MANARTSRARPSRALAVLKSASGFMQSLAKPTVPLKLVQIQVQAAQKAFEQHTRQEKKKKADEERGPDGSKNRNLAKERWYRKHRYQSLTPKRF